MKIWNFNENFEFRLIIFSNFGIFLEKNQKIPFILRKNRNMGVLIDVTWENFSVLFFVRYN